MNRSLNGLYWATTLLFAAINVLGGIAALSQSAFFMNALKEIAFPGFMAAFIGVAKLLGAAAIVLSPNRRLREWAYAGFTFELLGATYAHLMSGPMSKASSPLVPLAIGLASYYLFLRRADQREGVAPAVARNPVRT